METPKLILVAILANLLVGLAAVQTTGAAEQAINDFSTKMALLNEKNEDLRTKAQEDNIVVQIAQFVTSTLEGIINLGLFLAYFSGLILGSIFSLTTIVFTANNLIEQAASAIIAIPLWTINVSLGIRLFDKWMGRKPN